LRCQPQSRPLSAAAHAAMPLARHDRLDARSLLTPSAVVRWSGVPRWHADARLETSPPPAGRPCVRRRPGLFPLRRWRIARVPALPQQTTPPGADRALQCGRPRCGLAGPPAAPAVLHATAAVWHTPARYGAELRAVLSRGGEPAPGGRGAPM